MKLLMDLQALQNESRNRGIGRYVKSLFDALAQRDDIELYALLNGAMTETLSPAMKHAAERIAAERILVFPGIPGTKLERPENLHRWRLSEAAYEAFVAQSGCDAILAGSVVEGFIDGTSLSLRAPNADYVKAVILYDLIPLMYPAKYLAWDKARDWYFERITHVEAADLALTISESSRQEGLEYLGLSPERAVAISTAMDPIIFNSQDRDENNVLAHIGVTKPFVMHTSAIEPRKNFEGLIRAFGALPASIRRNHQLVLVGHATDEIRKSLLTEAQRAGLPPESLVIPGFVSDRDLACLYRACSLFVFPSLHEGFGLPALEAMACGCPTIGSNITSIPEVIGDPAYLFDPFDESAITRLMKHLLTDKAAYEKAKAHAQAHAATFGWDKVADRAVQALAAALKNRPPKPTAYPSAARMARHLATRVELAECPASDVEEAARCLVAGQDELVSKLADGLARRGKTWRIEGPFDSSYSLAVVNRETARAMANIGWQVVLHSTEGPGDFPANPDFLAANLDLAKMHARATKVSQKASFAVSRLLYPPRVEDMTGPITALHHYAWEESGFPQEWVDNFNTHLTMMTTLSTHIEKIMVDNGVSVPLVTSGCGVDHWDRIVSDREFRIEARGFRFLHVSSCFPRKGADALLAAYGAAFDIDDDVSLVIKTFDNPHNDLREKLAGLQARNPRFPHVVVLFADLSEPELKALYEQCDVMVGPSYAEGYGLPFAEAMLSGIPVITTAWGGQLDFCNTGNSWLVDYEFERARTHFGVWASAWARVKVPALSAAMLEAYSSTATDRAAMALRGRNHLLARHSWEDVARRLTAAATTLPAIVQPDPRIGWISTWHSKCGIATYSQHLVAAIPNDVTVFAPVNEAPLIGKDDSIRCWRQAKDRSELWRILAHPEAQSLDAFIIQFNYGFYNHTELTRFICHAKAMGKTVITCLHSTVDPPNEGDVQNFHLEWLRTGLSACDRILVHSIDDLNRLKDIGLVENVALFPHGVLRRQLPAPARSRGKIQTIGTYGFALPHKGLPEMLFALRLLHDSGWKVRLRMVNAEYPLDFSAALIDGLKQLIQELDLRDYVELHTEFLPDEESLRLLTDTDIVVFPYQNTAESASGAVRYGMAVERPVAVTPLPIFADLEGSVHELPGTTPADIASGLSAILDAIGNNTAAAATVADQASRWRAQHDYAVIGKRLSDMCKALSR